MYFRTAHCQASGKQFIFKLSLMLRLAVIVLGVDTVMHKKENIVILELYFVFTITVYTHKRVTSPRFVVGGWCPTRKLIHD